MSLDIHWKGLSWDWVGEIKTKRVDFTSCDLGGERVGNFGEKDYRREVDRLEAAGLVRLKGRYTYLPPTLHYSAIANRCDGPHLELYVPVFSNLFA